MYYQDHHVTLYNKSCLNMGELPDNSIQCVVTSPPYWGLRKYDGEQDLIWGGDNHHEHEWGKRIAHHKGHAGTKSTLVGTQIADLSKVADQSGQYCSLCGAWRGSYGLEPTPELYVAHTILILREIRRVLRKDGVVFWNVGDSYATGAGSGRVMGGKVYGKQNPLLEDGNYPECQPNRMKIPGLKPKDLCLIPARVALAVQMDGWWVRSDIIWSNPNPMPESVTDRPTDAYEHIIMLTKSARYFWDKEAVREKSDWNGESGNKNYRANIGWANEGMNSNGANPAGRNLRNVWEFATQPYPEAHFATFPEELPERCIKAATPEYGCCSKCGAPWERVLEYHRNGKDWNKNNRDGGDRLAVGRSASEGMPNNYKPPTTTGWRPTCSCNAEVVPSTVLDPFAGSGTTLWMAKRLNRRVIGYEISPEYCELSVKRNRQQVIF